MKRTFIGIILLVITLVIFGVSAFTTASKDIALINENRVLPQDGLISLPTRRQLRRSFFDKREILIVYGTENNTLKEKYKALLDTINQIPQNGRRRNATFLYKEVSDVTASDIQNNILFLIGTPKEHPLLKRFIAAVPIDISDRGIVFDTKVYQDPSDILSVSFYPNPENNTLPFSFFTGNDPLVLYNFFEGSIQKAGASFFWQNMDYELYETTNRAVMGNFNTQWQLDTTTHFDYSEGNNIIAASTNYTITTHQKELSKETTNTLILGLENTYQNIIDFTGYKDTIPKITYHIYKTAEDKGLLLGNTQQAHIDIQNNAVHTIINDKYLDNYIEKENELILHHTLGEASSKTLSKGLSVYFTDQWQREGFPYWTARLFESENVLTLKELFDNELIEKESPLLTECMSASLVTFLIDQLGKETFLQQYKDWTPSTKELKSLEVKWQRYLAKEAIKYPKKKRAKPAINYLKGFNFAHEGYSIYNGYLSQKATEAIAKQQDMGSNALAIVPYSYIRMGSTPTYLSIGSRAGSENDQGVVHSAYEAKKRGMQSLLKPQVFFGSSWPGALTYETEADWNAFFDYYYRWIRHYAFLAEIHQIDALCMGVEFVKATLSHSKQWKEMFKKTRGLYQGNLTYAANWGEEFETIDFWNELDFIGLNSYYPLSKNDTPTDEELKTNFEGIKTKIEKVYQAYKKPIVFTEIGFRSIEMPWKNPHADGDTPFNDTHQRRCYEVIFEGIENEPWCAGILWWKFPSYLEYRGIENTAFTPNNKATEATVRKWFSE
ncbi:glycosyl hydrolase [uncultured Dokdonia sp.]|uniref:glycoside hydrolase family 113 n=1 Tax=uncultured Dokdonia sp. TaxID=575653 RepID=UPI002621A801|nr:glycosyl hydrolase [uncultured Dokdonia sp.]